MIVPRRALPTHSAPTAMFAGMSMLPKKSVLTQYSCRLSHDHQQKFLAALDKQMIVGRLATESEAIFDLDSHAIMHRGTDPVLEKNYVPTRSRRARPVLTFFAQYSATHNLVHANADLSKAAQAREAIAFCDHWKRVSGVRPEDADHGPDSHHPEQRQSPPPAADSGCGIRGPGVSAGSTCPQSSAATKARLFDAAKKDRALLAIQSIEQELRDLGQQVTSIECRLAGEDA
jgi:hypothetical protein